MDNAADIRAVLESWAESTRQGRLDDVLTQHAGDAVIYDVLPPLRYEGAAAYRASWDDWQPDIQSGGEFALEDLQVQADDQCGYAFGLIRCGDTYPDGRKLSDLVRATFCLKKIDGKWTVTHQHISKPYAPK